MEIHACDRVVSRNRPVDKTRWHRTAIYRDAQASMAQRLLMIRDRFGIHGGNPDSARDALHIVGAGQFPQSSKQPFGGATR